MVVPCSTIFLQQLRDGVATAILTAAADCVPMVKERLSEEPDVKDIGFGLEQYSEVAGRAPKPTLSVVELSKCRACCACWACALS